LITNKLKHPSGWVSSRPERNGILPPPDGSDFDNYVPGRITSDGFSTEYNAYTYSYIMYEVTVTASRYTWAGQWCRDYTWNRREQYSSEYSGGEVYISPTTNSGGGGGGGIGMGANNQFGNSKLTPSAVNYVATGVGTITGYQKSLWEKPKSRAQKAINQKKAYETQKALKQKGITKSVKEIKAGKITNLNKASNVLGATGVLISSYELYTTNEIKPSHLYDFTASATCFALGVFFVSSPAGWIAGAVFLGAEVVSYAFTGQSVGEHLNNNINWSYKRY